MNWKFKLIDAYNTVKRYAYSRESSELDGVISYNSATGKITIENPCKADASVFAKDWSAIQFYKVVKAGFPDELNVCCG